MIEVVAAIIKVRNKFLCCQRSKNKYNYLSRKFEFPGGKVEKNETKEEALIREIKEELCLDVLIDKFFTTINYSYPDFDLEMHCFFCSVEQLDIKLNDHISYELIELEKLKKLDWVPADLKLISLLENNNGI
tara:strand:- start:1863 stop:2258 length:396 start_codon:yes stop_codon:yes gene_type:complete